MFNFFGNKKSEATQQVEKKKSAPDWTWALRAKPSWYNFSSVQCYLYYAQSSPLFTAIDRVVTAAKIIKPLVFDKSTDDFTDNHPLLTLLENPNTNLAWSEFVGQFATNLLISGNNFTIATNGAGRIDKPPNEIFIEPPQNLTIIADTRDGYAGTYQLTDSYYQIQFYRDDRQFRFFDSKYRDTAMREIYQTKNFSPYTGQWQRLWGISNLYPIYYELEQFKESSVHNLSVLKKGARPSGIIYIDNEVSDEQVQRIQHQVSSASQGSDNSGMVMVIASKDGSFQEMSVTNKDMDFLELKKNVTNAIYNIYKIPLPLVSPDSMTMNNYEIAQLALYDNAVLPLVEWIYQELTAFLMPRYDDSGNLSLAYDPRQIPALQIRHTQQLTNLNSTGVVKTNELRALLKLEPTDGGDEIYIDGTKVPMSYAANAAENADNSVSPEPAIPLPEADEAQAKKMFVAGMIEYGAFNAAEIEKIWTESLGIQHN